MYTVGLVQNQSEMSHYACADARPLLAGYDYRLFTGDDIAELGVALERRQLDAVVLGSNALNDKNILAALCRPDFAAQVAALLQAQGGLLCLQQLGLAMRGGPTLSALPAPYGRLLPKVPPAGDTALRTGRLTPGASAAHVAMSYPSPVDLDEIREQALAFRGYQGLYRHYWDQVDLADWDQLVVDPSSGQPRSLVLASKESAPGRVVVSALPLDWQKHEELFGNLVAYTVEGRHSVAALVEGDGDARFDYLRKSLQARRLPYGEYTLPDDRLEAARNIGAGIHSTLLIGADTHVEDLPEPLLGRVREGVLNGRVRLVDIGPGAFGVRGINLVSHELRPRHLLVAVEMQVQTELRTGYVDDSFWSHVETLQTIEQLPDRAVRYADLQDAAFAITRNHDRAGSYDELFGPTCALYWLRATYLGASSPEAETSAAWLRANLPEQELIDRALAYHALASVGRLTTAERDDLSAVLATLDLDALSESQLVLHLRAALAASLDVAQVAELAAAVTARQHEGSWLDLTTTATAANSLLDCHRLLGTTPAYTELRGTIERAVQDALIVVLRDLARWEDDPAAGPYPWEGKARTTTKCLQAWLKFDSLQDLPVYELVGSLARSGQEATQHHASRTALTMLEKLSDENRRLRAETTEQSGLLSRAATQHRQATIAAAVGALVLYALVTLIVGLTAQSSLGHGIKAGFVDGWVVHSTVLGIVFSVIGLRETWRRKAAPKPDPEHPKETG